MIENERQYSITKMQAEKFRRSLEEFDEDISQGRVKDRFNLRGALASQLADLKEEMAEYEK